MPPYRNRPLDRPDPGLQREAKANRFSLHAGNDLSNDLQDATGPIVKFDDEQGLELFYNYALTLWFRVTADIQWSDPAKGKNAKAWVAGPRANLTF